MILPDSVKACLWSYDTDLIDLGSASHRARIIQNVLNRGTKEAVDWLLQNFSPEEISATITGSSEEDWNKKSLSLWSLIFEALPGRKGRFA